MLADQLLDVQGAGGLAALDERIGVLQAFAMTRHAEALKVKLLASDEWRNYHDAHRVEQEVRREESDARQHRALLQTIRAQQQRRLRHGLH